MCNSLNKPFRVINAPMSGIDTGGGGTLGFLPWRNSLPPKIWLNCQWFMMAFMMISLHVVIIIKLMFKVNTQNLISDSAF